MIQFWRYSYCSINHSLWFTHEFMASWLKMFFNYECRQLYSMHVHTLLFLFRWVNWPFFHIYCFEVWLLLHTLRLLLDTNTDRRFLNYHHVIVIIMIYPTPCTSSLSGQCPWHGSHHHHLLGLQRTQTHTCQRRDPTPSQPVERRWQPYFLPFVHVPSKRWKKSVI